MSAALNRPLTRAEVADLCECRVSDIPAAPSFSLTAFTPPGPVCAAYIRSMGPVDLIMGPGGSGKTIGSFFKVIRFAVGAVPVCTDGVVRCRGTVLRDNYRSLYRTTLRSWFRFFPPDYPGSTFFGGADRPAQHRLKLSTVRTLAGVRREVPVDLEIDFFAVGDLSIDELLKSYETTIGYCNEIDQLPLRVPQFLFGRTGRYPALDQLPPGTVRPRVVCGDMNPPKPNHPILKAAERGTFRDPRIGHNGGPDLDEPSLEEGLGEDRAINFFKQPSGLSPQAENRAGKTYEEYAEDLRVMTEEDGRRMVHGLPGFATDGMQVYLREFRRSAHVSPRPLAIIPGLPLHLGLDQGGSPAAVLFQVSSHGQVRVLRELYIGQGVGYGRFLEALVPLLNTPPLLGLPPGAYTADPAGFYGADKEAGELAWAQSIARGLGHAVYPAGTNEPATRQEAVKLRLRYQIDGETPGLIIDPSCELLIEGFEAEYKFPKLSEKAATEYGDGPIKNKHSNVHDALQYGVLGVFGATGVVAEAARAGRPANVVSLHRSNAAAPSGGDGWDFSPFG